MLHLRLASPYLPDHEYSDYLAAQYQDIIDVCDATMPELVIRAPPDYEDSPKGTGNQTKAINGTVATNGTNQVNSTCS